MKSLLILRFFLGSVFVLILHVNAMAQVANPPAPDVPITGIEILIGAGVLLGARKVMRSRNKR